MSTVKETFIWRITYLKNAFSINFSLEGKANMEAFKRMRVLSSLTHIHTGTKTNADSVLKGIYK